MRPAILCSFLLCFLVLPPASADECVGWEYFPAPSPGDFGQLLGVKAFAPEDAWTVGWHSDPDPANSDVLSLISRWDGESWTRVSSPNPGIGASRDVYLYAVDGLSPDDLWAVGTYRTVHKETGFVGFQTLAMHWDGSEWTHVETPQTPAGGTGATFHDVQALAPDDVWAAGFRVEPNGPGFTVITVQHWDGSAWSELPTPKPLSRNDNTGFAFHVFREDNIVVVGGHDGDYNSGPRYPFVARWDGSDWSYDDIPQPGQEGYLNTLRGLTALGPDNLWAVGEYSFNDGGSTRVRPYILHHDGTSWELADTSHFDRPYGRLTAVNAVAPDDVWAVGTYTAEQPPSPSRKLILHWDGEHWTQEPEDPDGPVDGTLWAVTSIPGIAKAWTVGQDGDDDAPTERLCPVRDKIFLEDFEQGNLEKFVR